MSFMFDPESWTKKLSRWLQDEALPLWAGVGVDSTRDIVWEALSPDGKPCKNLNRRLRVQARQAYSFGKNADPKYQKLGAKLFRQIMDNGFDPETGHLVTLYSEDNSILAAPHDLYDLSFVLLAASSLIDAGFDLTPDLARLVGELDKLKAPKGWYENAQMQTPRRQNPHMHLFEASTALFHATGEGQYREMAQECLDLFLDIFLQNDYVLLEFFSQNLCPCEMPKQAVEPGHMAEWIFLIDQFERVTGRNSNAPLVNIFEAVVVRRDEDGLLPDRSDSKTEKRRIWPQTELLKAAIVMWNRGFDLDETARPEMILETLWGAYFCNSIKGGWVDTMGVDQKFMSKNIETSCFYHVYMAFSFYCAEAEQYNFLEAGPYDFIRHN